MAYRILIVDDETLLTELLSSHLQDHGYMVSVANSSDEALAKLNTKDKVNGLRAGGDDYITKPFGLQELTARIEAHLRRDERNKRPPEVVTSQGLIINLSNRKVFWNEQELTFSKREFDIIEFLSSNPNQVFDKERIYEAVWGYDAEGENNVIKEHIRKIRAKLMQTSGSEYIETVWGMGYRWKK